MPTQGLIVFFIYRIYRVSSVGLQVRVENLRVAIFGLQSYSILQVLLPLIVAGISLLVLLVQITARGVRWERSDGYKPLQDRFGGYDGPGHPEEVTDDSDEDEHLTVLGEGNEQRNDYGPPLRPILSRSDDSIFEVDRPRGEIVLVAFEEIAVIAELAIYLAALLTQVRGRKGQLAAWAGLLTWSYIFILASIRLFLSATSRRSYPNIWNHTTFLYISLWFVTVVQFGSAMIHPRSELAQSLTTVDFILVSVLGIIALSSRRGNRPVILEHEHGLEPSREPLGSLLSRVTFGWADPIVWRGYKNTLELPDIWDLASNDKAAAIVRDFRQVKKTSKLAWHLLKYFRRLFLLQAAWAAFAALFTFAPTLLLKAILEYIEEPEVTPINAAWLYVILLLVTGIITAVGEGQALWIGRRICIRLRAVIIGEIYAKALRRKMTAGVDTVLGAEDDEKIKRGLIGRAFTFGRKKKAKNTDASQTQLMKPKEDSQANVGTIINLMAVDSYKLSEVSAYLHFLWASVPIEIVLSVVLLYRLLGYSSIAGIVVMAVLLPINIAIANGFSKIQKKIMAATDARIHITNEVLQNIRIIKFFAWEHRFGQMVNGKRSAELRSLRNRYILWSVAATIWYGAPLIIAFLSFFIYTVVEKKALIPSVAFTALSLFSILRIPLDQLADMLAHVQESKVSVDRVEEFLSEEETEKYHQLQRVPIKENGRTIIGLRHATCTWGGRAPTGDKDTSAFRLLDMDVTFCTGKLNVIAGPTGAGKTSLLMALLGEMTLLEGQVFLPGGYIREQLKPDKGTGLTESVAYCAQQAWLVNDTIKQNILFANRFNEKRYKDVIVACSLEKDLEILQAGDETLVGEKGIALSGGQKQRISLARALYSSSRHILLDDCLSAVDSHTAKWIFDHCIMGPLMHNRTCILVTHNIVLCVPPAEHVVVLDNGKIVAQGPPEKVISSGALGEEIQTSRANSKTASRVSSRRFTEPGNGEARPHVNGLMNGHSNGIMTRPGKDDDKAVPNKHTETKAEGGVKWPVMKLFLISMGPWYYWIVALAIFAGQQLSSVATNVWIRQWANSYHRIQVSTSVSTETYHAITSSHVNAGYYLSIYASLVIGYMLISAIREGTLFYGSLSASRRIHQSLLDSVCRAKFGFFDSTPLGQIMNRFSKDIEAVDQEVAPIALSVLHCLASVITIVILISVITPGFLIAGVFITVLYIIIGKFYIRASRDLKRLESVQRSPLYQQFGETLSGIITIRAYGEESRFIRENLHRVNTHNRPFIYLWATNRWLALRVDVAGALVSFFAGCFVVLNARKIDPGAAGLSLIYAVTFTENVLWLVRLYSANEQNMNSVERIKEYLDVEREAQPIIPDARPPANWPSEGAVQFINYSTRYRSDLDPVLRNVNFSIQPLEKVGIVGRTGAGKSSLALALFRGLEAEEGKILIDGIDIGLIGLQDLREHVTIVPQDPTLFTGTIRSNLDPFNLFTEEEVFTALRRVRLINGPEAAGEMASRPSTTETTSSSTPATTTTTTTTNKNIFHDLSSAVTESGNNLSQGQKQLLCLARAMLKQPRVILMDEATASIDYSTDAKIQGTIRELKSTTITIAHRLQTIIDYDKVLVLDKGEVKEFDHPWRLLSKPDSLFRDMCEMSGDLEVLEKAAREAWRARQLVDVDEDGDGTSSRISKA
ncbi:MAG: hypothetical protein M1816_003214 [Peltula sp. TS41687]|nr:MAG: hypothetical protein M1816_003214 [Peltula sp. TS41687]